MALLDRLDAVRAPAGKSPRQNREFADEGPDLSEFEAELERLAAANRELLGEINAADAHDDAPADPREEMDCLRAENADLKARLEELEAIASGQGAELWQERQREYEMLLEEKSEVIRSLHQKIQEMQESVSFGTDVPANPGASASRLGQAEEILRLKRELEDQRRQLEQDEEDMMTQMRTMEMTMARERAEMARQRQEIQRLQAELSRAVETNNRDPELRERLKSLRRPDSKPTLPAPSVDQPEAGAPPKSTSNIFRRIFG